MAKPIRPEPWLEASQPTAADRQREAAWLDLHWEYGARIHEVGADALVAALGNPSDVATGHGLFLRLLAEFAGSLETLGAWGWALRTRRESPLFLDRFLAYPNRVPREFFTAVRRNRSGSLIRLLTLPSRGPLIRAVVSGFDWDEEEAERALGECFLALREAAGHYFAEDEAFRVTYNRAKHGATMIRPEQSDMRRFEVISPNLDSDDPRRYLRHGYQVNAQAANALRSRIELNARTVQFLAGLTRALLLADLLYPRRTRSAGARTGARNRNASIQAIPS